MNPLKDNEYILGLGSNIGLPLKNLRSALQQLQTLSDLNVRAISSVYISDAELPENAPYTWKKSYLNLAVRIETTLSPSALHQKIQTIEKKIGREQDARWAPRLIDIDILTWGKNAYQDETLCIPHRSLWTRPFALLPLVEIDPDFRSPKMNDIPWLKNPETAPFHTRKIQACLSGPALVGIVNVTPDSFSDGNSLPTLDKQYEHVKNLILAGAEVIDIGAESTRPHATRVSLKEEWERLELILNLCLDLPRSLGLDPALMPEISLDSFHPETIEKALNESSIDWVNDVSGASVEKMVSLLKGSNVRYVTMHNLGIPPSPSNTLPPGTNPIAHLTEWSLQRIHLLETLGLSSDQIILDVGIGFGLTTQQNWQVLQSAGSIKTALSTLNIPVLVGHSRKSFLKSSLIEDTLPMRDLASSLITFHLAEQNIDYLRIHAVPLMNQTIKIFSQLNR